MDAFEQSLAHFSLVSIIRRNLFDPQNVHMKIACKNCWSVHLELNYGFSHNFVAVAMCVNTDGSRGF